MFSLGPAGFGLFGYSGVPVTSSLVNFSVVMSSYEDEECHSVFKNGPPHSFYTPQYAAFFLDTFTFCDAKKAPVAFKMFFFFRCWGNAT
jgi:hypothetical protein